MDPTGAFFGDVMDTIGKAADIASLGCIGVQFVNPVVGTACGFIAGGVSLATSATNAAREPGIGSGAGAAGSGRRVRVYNARRKGQDRRPCFQRMRWCWVGYWTEPVGSASR